MEIQMATNLQENTFTSEYDSKKSTDDIAIMLIKLIAEITAERLRINN